MPQMMPMMWITALIYNLIMLCLLMIFTYFSRPTLHKDTCNINMNKSFNWKYNCTQNTWKWKW